MRKKGQLPRSNLEFLQDEGVFPEDMSLEQAVRELADPLNCVECIAVKECADQYGHIRWEASPDECQIVVRAFLNEDHREEKSDGRKYKEPHA